MWFTIKKLRKNILGIGEFKHFEKVISYLIIGKDKCLLIDTGLGIKNIRNEIRMITNKPIVVINTHSHFDHVGGNKFFKKIIKSTNKKTINMNPFKFDLIKTPGHTPDSICIFEKKQGWLFSGDTLYQGPIYLHLKQSNLNDYKKSLKKLLKIKILRVFPAHNDFLFPIKNIRKIYTTLINKKGLKNIETIDKKTSLLIE